MQSGYSSILILYKRIIYRLLNYYALRYSFFDLVKLFLNRFYPDFTTSKSINVKSIQAEIWETKIIVISLPFREDRRQYQRVQLQASTDWRFSNAQLGENLTVGEISKYFSTFSSNRLTSGNVGCIISHIYEWQKFLEENYKYLIVLEDDVILTKKVDFIKEILYSIPEDFDITILGNNSKKRRTRLIYNQYFIKPIFPRKGLFGYIISKKGATKILSEMLPIKITTGGLDTCIGWLIFKQKIIGYQLLNDFCKHNYFFESNIINYSRPNKKMYSKV